MRECHLNTLSRNSQSIVNLANSVWVASAITLGINWKKANGNDMINADLTNGEQLLELQF